MSLVGKFKGLHVLGPEIAVRSNAPSVFDPIGAAEPIIGRAFARPAGYTALRAISAWFGCG